jgi:hypothetical protein
MTRHFLVLKRFIAIRAAKVAGLGGQYDEIEIIRTKMPELVRLRDHRGTQLGDGTLSVKYSVPAI